MVELKQCKIAPNKGVLEATDIDEHAHNLRNWQQQYDQISNGRFYGRIDEVVLDQVHTFHEFTSHAVKQQCNVWPNSIWFGFSANDKKCRINGEIISENQVMIRPGNTQFELVTPEQFDIFGVVVNQDALINVAEKQGVELRSADLFSSPCSRQLKRLNNLKHILNDLLRPEHAGSVSTIQQDILITTVLDILQKADDIKHVRPSFSHRKAVVDKIETYLQSNLHRPLTITELCEMAHVSRRTLQYSFEDILGISPLRYLRIMRLNAVRRTLLKDFDYKETISEVAERWGFLHAGQFSHDYTQLFGENPSTTAERKRAAVNHF